MVDNQPIWLFSGKHLAISSQLFQANAKILI
jgi:hypothetical protein